MMRRDDHEEMSREIMTRSPVTADQRVRYGGDVNQFFDIYRSKADPPLGMAVMIHGGFWRARYDLSSSSHLCAALAKTGFTAVNLEYRRVGQPGGGWPGTYEDIRSGYREALSRLSARKSVVLGHSAGGHLALRLAIDNSGMAGAIGLAPVACIDLAYHENLGNGAVVDFLGDWEGHRKVYEDADPSHHASPVPRILIHGGDDDIVPISISRAFVSLRERDTGHVKLITIPTGDHFDVIDPTSAAWPTVLASVRGVVRD